MGRGLVVAVLVLAATAMGALVRPAPTAAASNREDQMRDQIGQFLNMERTGRGLRALPIDVHLQSQAQAWSEHNRDAGCETSCHSTHDEGEILAWGGTNARSGKLVQAWMQSANHRNILLYPDATAMGIGLACAGNGEAYATVQFYDVYRTVPPTDEQPIATSDAWGAPCEGMEGPVPPTSTSTPTTLRGATTTSTAAPRPRATTTTAPPRRRPTPPTTTATVAAPTLPAPTTTTSSVPTTSSSTSTTSPRIALRADGSEIPADGSVTSEEAEAFAQSAATPANAERAWVAIVVCVLLLSGMRIGAQLHELRAARRLEDS